MENDAFIKKLIKGTKEDKLNWELYQRDRLFRDYESYYLEKGDKKLIISKYTASEYDGFGEEVLTQNCSLSICDERDKSLGKIYEDDLKKSSNLWRLYRLAERQVNNVDSIMEDFVEGIDDIEF